MHYRFIYVQRLIIKNHTSVKARKNDSQRSMTFAEKLHPVNQLRCGSLLQFTIRYQLQFLFNHMNLKFNNPDIICRPF